MTWFEDGSPYTYFAGEEASLNAGWLERGKPFPVAKATPEFRAALRALCVPGRLVRRTRGFHDCDLCVPVLNAYGAERTPSGSSEIRVPGGSGTVWAAPELILHYVEVHDYLPPDDFVRGVLNGS